MDDEVFGDQASGVMVMWGRRPVPRSGPKPAMSLERITDAAIEIADAEGLAAVTMQKVAGSLGFTKMSLYRYVPGRAELVALMIDRALGEPPDLSALSGWREKLREWAHRMWATLRHHRWLLGAMTGVRAPGPNELGWTERGVDALGGTGLTGPEQMDAVFVVSGHVRTVAQQVVTATGARKPERELAAMLTELLRAHGDRYPALRAAVAAEPETARDNALDFGLDRILDGLELHLARRAGA
ncbi:TetR/AcrR family transcriptional regulator [Amycolatopsis anabasis]|uniref:TetR/AcrR family transcriptional regulator n=1 Tax=Amycolatopsis anabasis TaxID=1840409 RepID=UPI0015D22146|nr:TetR/AcrR family transcriptional regulator [Amycolatopsis anabasis]